MSKVSKENFKKGDYIFFEGDVETHFYIIDSGEVSIFTNNKQNQKVEVARLKDGEIFGEFALIDQGKRTASAIALTDVKVMKVSAEGYESMVGELPLWASTMLKSFIMRLKQMNGLLKESRK